MKRSRHGCKNCKRLKIKCDENKPMCTNCIKRNRDNCDYSITLTWGGRPYKDKRQFLSKFPNTKVIAGVITTNFTQELQHEDNITNIQSLSCLNKVHKKKRKKNEKTPIKTSNIQTNYKTLMDKIIPQKGKKNFLETSGLPSPLPPSLLNSPSSINSQLEAFNLQFEDFEEDSLDTNQKSIFPAPLSANTLENDNTVDSDFQPLCESPCYSVSNVFLTTNRIFHNTCQDIFHPVDNDVNAALRKNLFDFYLNETSQFFVPAPTDIYINPFKTVLPHMALNSTGLLNLILAFGATHKKKLLIPNPKNNSQEEEQLKDFHEALTDFDIEIFLSKTMHELLMQLKDEKKAILDTTLATVMLLALFNIFFSQEKSKWRVHIWGAKKIVKKRFENMLISPSNIGSEESYFLLRWFHYVDVVSALSSITRVVFDPEDNNDDHQWKFNFKIDDHLDSKRLNLSDIEYFTGMDMKVLEFLSDISTLIRKRERHQQSIPTHEIMVEALDLSFDLENYLNESESKRDLIAKCHYTDFSSVESLKKYKNYLILRGTNLVFALTGLLQLKRRVLNIPHSSKSVKKLLETISTTILEKIPLGSSASSCIIFVFFCSGSDLIEDDMRHHRKVHIDHLDHLIQRGMTSAIQAKRIMLSCWEEKKPWWEVLKESNIDISFAI
ncbi:Zn(II)2Cys6 transcription factor SCDLUD_004403 [Saccharomycodes ludwigii]|uniref:Zn(II)2Cys6 transcription factor n=1 Tax=Saccharomycodes ludwigii TaxID=36035 RepID=UPI001E8935A1|nr:hypothetical protein SCDLUD_004403 [Saccharomycodes ludwigii]KAH3900083.1 hypothetical protein SCDLUD_004403 [Saccharomycodes ludwigii]